MRGSNILEKHYNFPCFINSRMLDFFLYYGEFSAGVHSTLFFSRHGFQQTKQIHATMYLAQK